MEFKTNTIIGEKIMDIHNDFSKTHRFKTYEDVMKNRVAKNMTLEFKDSKGNSNWYEFHVNPAPDGILVISTNITDRILDQQIILKKN